MTLLSDERTCHLKKLKHARGTSATTVVNTEADLFSVNYTDKTHLLFSLSQLHPFLNHTEFKQAAIFLIVTIFTSAAMNLGLSFIHNISSEAKCLNTSMYWWLTSDDEQDQCMHSKQHLRTTAFSLEHIWRYSWWGVAISHFVIVAKHVSSSAKEYVHRVNMHPSWLTWAKHQIWWQLVTMITRTGTA